MSVSNFLTRTPNAGHKTQREKGYRQQATGIWAIPENFTLSPVNRNSTQPMGRKLHAFNKVILIPVERINLKYDTLVNDVPINSLRKKIDKDFSQKLIHTRKGYGYLLSEEPPTFQ